MESNKLVFICNEFSTTDHMPSDVKIIKFSDANDFLWEKYNPKISEYIKDNISNVLTGEKEIKERNPLLFSIMLASGQREAISHSDDLSEIAEKTDTVFWSPTVGGGNISSQKFAIHAYSLINYKNKKYSNWKEIEPGNFGYGIRAVGPDPDGTIHTWVIKPTNGYPTRPPIVTAEPEFTNDVCWKNGQLNYTGFRIKNGNPWLYFVDNFQNPLKVLIDELFSKYKFGA